MLFRSVTRSLAILAGSKDIQLNVLIAPGLPQWLRGDPMRLRQVLLNLASNAVKFTPQGTVEIHAKGEAKGGEPDMIELAIEVRDCGIGIAPDRMDRLFQSFSQADSSINRRFGGTGLGLAISKQLIELMGGRIWVRSKLGVGSCFGFELPCRLGKARLGGEAPGPYQAAGRAARNLHVLVVEDNETNRILVEMMLERFGHRASSVADGLQAIEAVRKHAFDLVLMDVQMPEMDGLAATSAIRRLEGSMARVPIIALTANAMTGDRNRYLAAGFNDYIAKPISQRSLHEAIATVTGLPRHWVGRNERPKSNVALFDKGRISEMKAFLDDDKFYALMSSLPREIGKHMARLRSAIAAGSTDECRAALHGLKGLATNFAAERLAATARRLEQDGASVNATQIELPQLLLAIAETEAALRAMLAAVEPVGEAIRPSGDGREEPATISPDPH